MNANAAKPSDSVSSVTVCRSTSAPRTSRYMRGLSMVTTPPLDVLAGLRAGDRRAVEGDPQRALPARHRRVQPQVHA